MTTHPTPNISQELAKRIRIVRRDASDLLFHFTKGENSQSAGSNLHNILVTGKLFGSSKWSEPDKVVCFTEAPIQEFNSIFSLVSIAASKEERPRYEPYGVAVSKRWLYEQGGRPVIYDSPAELDSYPQSLRYRFVPYDPAHEIDFTWEREWRLKTAELALDPKYTFAVVPTSEEAFELVYGFSDVEHEWDSEDFEDPSSAYITGFYHKPRWLAVSLSVFGFNNS